MGFVVNCKNIVMHLVPKVNSYQGQKGMINKYNSFQLVGEDTKLALSCTDEGV